MVRWHSTEYVGVKVPKSGDSGVRRPKALYGGETAVVPRASVLRRVLSAVPVPFPRLLVPRVMRYALWRQKVAP